MSGPVVRASTPKTDLALSAVPDLLPEDARIAAYIEDQLAQIDFVRDDGYRGLADELLAQLFDYVLGRTDEAPDVATVA